MQTFYSDQFSFPLSDGHRFPLQKYELLRQEALARGVLAPHELVVPEAATDEELLYVHSAAYLRKVVTGQLSEKELRRIGLPWSPELVERSRRSVGGTLCACRAALRDGIAGNLGGGTHHAFPDHGAGFCVFNDVAIAARAMLTEGRAAGVAILDCDVHQGDGTAAIFKDDPAVFTFSIHGARNYPFRKQQSHLDAQLDDGAGDTEYLSALHTGLQSALDRVNADLAIYLAGADPYEGDRLGRLAVSKTGLAKRDRFALELCRDRGIPVAIVLSGGYARDIRDVVEIHLETIRIASELSARANPPGT